MDVCARRSMRLPTSEASPSRAQSRPFERRGRLSVRLVSRMLVVRVTLSFRAQRPRGRVHPNSLSAHCGQYGTTSGGLTEARYIRQRSVSLFHGRWHSWHEIGLGTIPVLTVRITASFRKSRLMGSISAIQRHRSVQKVWHCLVVGLDVGAVRAWARLRSRGYWGLSTSM